MLEQPAVHEYFEDQPRLAARFPRMDAGEMGWVPAVDVRETTDEIVVFAALPGVAKEDMAIRVEGQSFTVSGRRRQRADLGWLRRELIAGPFLRTVTLPAAV